MTTKKRLIFCKSQGICPNCSNKIDNDHTFCSDCRRKARDKYKSKIYPNGIKRCLDCKCEIPIKNTRTPNRCPNCLLKYRNEWTRRYYASHPEAKKRIQKYDKERYANNRDKIREQKRETSIFRLYGISYNEFISIFHYQNGKCAICGLKLPDIDNSTKTRKNTFIDHNHTTGKIRGILCPNCNFGLGNFKDDINILENAIQYLANNM
jgi:hypothetical protein